MKYRFERTFDYELIAAAISHPKLYPHIADDFYPLAEHFWPLESKSIFHLCVHDGAGEFFGLYITHPITAVLWEVHHALLPNAWGVPAFEIGRDFESWLWANTLAETAIGFTSSDNRLALKYAKRHGMTEVGRIPRGVKRGGVLHDLHLFGKHRPDELRTK